MKLQINVPVSGLDLASLLQGAELHYCGKGWSLDRLRADANRPGNPRTAVRYAWAGTLGRHEDKQLDRVCRIPRDDLRQIDALSQDSKSGEEKIKSLGWGNSPGLFDLVSCVQAGQTRFLKRSTIGRFKKAT